MKKYVYILIILSIVMSWGSYQYYKVIEINESLKDDIKVLEEKLAQSTLKSDELYDKNDVYNDKISELEDLEKMLEAKIVKLKESSALERILLDWYKKKEKTEDDISNILLVLPEVKWRKLSEIDDNIDSYELIEWVAGLNIQKEDDIINIIKLSQNVDGAYAECYSSIISNIFLVRDIKLMKALAKVSSYTESIGNHLAYSVYETDRFDITNKKMKGLLESEELSEEEKNVVRNFIDGFDKFIRLNYSE